MSTATGDEGDEPLAALPALSNAVPGAILMPRLPSPVMPLMRTVGVEVVPLSTLNVPAASPVVFSVMLPTARLTLVAPV